MYSLYYAKSRKVQQHGENILLACEAEENVVCCILDDRAGVLYSCVSKREESIEYFFKHAINLALLTSSTLVSNI